MEGSLKTVVAWNDGDDTVRPVGPTSQDASLLGGRLNAARAKFDGAEIMPWSRRDDTVAQVKALAEARRAEAAEVDRVIDREERYASDKAWYTELQTQVREAAKNAAQAFVEEFGTRCRAEDGDWDAEAWSIDSSGGGRLYPAVSAWADAHPDDDVTENTLRKLYLDTLYSESARLAAVTA